ncbi:MAG: P-loop NTPase [Halodesulfurarchaeum sp.]
MQAADVRELLSSVEDPDLGEDIVSEHVLRDVSVAGDVVTVRLALTAVGSPSEESIVEAVRDTLEREGLEARIEVGDPDSFDVEEEGDEADDAAGDESVGEGPGVENVGPGAEGGGPSGHGHGGQGPGGQGPPGQGPGGQAGPGGDAAAGSPLPGVTNTIAVASGKGGVGKSTIAVNLAAGLAERGADVALFDADMYGPNVPRMLGVTDRPEATANETIKPPEAYGMKVISIGLMIGEESPVIWRGAMVHNTLTQLIDDVEWGELDYMVIDLPPGTGDTQLTLLQTIPLTGSVIVTTPQSVALEDARRGLEMFAKHDSPVLGIVENMSSFVCPDCGSEHDIFGKGGGREFAAENDMPFLGAIPLDPEIRERGDEGAPLVMDEESDVGEAFRSMVAETADMVGILNRRALSE